MIVLQTIAVAFAMFSALPVPPETVDGARSMAEWVLLPQAAEQLAAHIATEKEEHL